MNRRDLKLPEGEGSELLSITDAPLACANAAVDWRRRAVIALSLIMKLKISRLHTEFELLLQRPSKVFKTKQTSVTRYSVRLVEDRPD
jgi:hypothetical protein